MALALYRSYRPGTLDDVVGQPHVTTSLARALSSGRIHHAYLFSGPRGCGKTSTARIMARCLNCEQGPTPTPCGQCRSCVELAPNGPGSIDVVELDAATHGGVDDARELREKAVYAPAASRFKVYIIDEAHQLSDAAANALLKLVEEPPAHLRFIFATTEPEKIIATIRSRTFHYGFRLVPARELTDHLAAICAAEGVPADPAALAVVARAGAGSVRDSLSVLGQLLAATDESGLTYADVVAALGVTDSALIDDFVAALAAPSAAQMFGVVDRVIAAGHDPRRFVADVLDRLRDLLVIQAIPQAVTTGLVSVPDDLAEVLVRQSSLVSPAELSRAADLVSQGLTQVKGATAPRLQLELLCARLALAPADSPDSGILARLALVERALSTLTGPGSSPAPQPAPAARASVGPGPKLAAPDEAAQPGQPAAPPRRPRATRSSPPGSPLESQVPDAAPPAPTPAQGETAGPTSPPEPVATSLGQDLLRVREAWPTILDSLRSQSRVAWMGFESATPLGVSQGALAVAVADAGRVTFLARQGHDERLRQAILAVLGLDLRIDLVLNPEAAGRTPATGAAGPQVSAAGPVNRAGSAAVPPVSQGQARGAGPTRGGGGTRSSAPPQVEPTPAPGWDEPTADDPDLQGDGTSGVELLVRELGGRMISHTDQD